MTAGLSAFHDQAVCAAALHADRHGHAGHDREHTCAALLEHLHVDARIACARRHERHLFLSDHLHELLRIRVHHHDIDAEGLIGERTAFADRLSGLFDIHRTGADDAHSAGIGYTGGKFSGGNVGHRALNDRILDLKHLI